MEQERINLVSNVSECSGCGACMWVCPVNAIIMQPDAKGCVYPLIRHDACIGCGSCLRQCRYRQTPQLHAPIAAYAAVAKDEELVVRSSSGGIFAALARNWMQTGGLVAGAVMDCDEGIRVHHVLSDSYEELKRMQGSKYVQSEAWHCYPEVKAALEAGRNVLFSGTPCQVTAIKMLTGNPDNLTTIDLVCHGVPPVKMLEDYVKILEKRFHGKIEGLCFRDKALKREYCARINLRSGKRKRVLYMRSDYMSFYRDFLKSANCRENCYDCPYAKIERASDMTIGDYWGIKKWHASDFKCKRMPQADHWSCVLVNTDKGQRLLEVNSKDIMLFLSKVEWVKAENRQLNHPTIAPDNRDELLKRYTNEGYKGVEAAFVRNNGGWLKYHLRLIKDLYRNRKMMRKHP